MPANGAVYHAISTTRPPSPSTVQTATSSDPSAPSPPHSYAKHTISPVAGSTFGCAATVGTPTCPSKSHRPTVSSVSGSIANGGPSSFIASNAPRQNTTFVLLAVRTTPRTPSSSVNGLRYRPNSARRAAVSAIYRSVRTYRCRRSAWPAWRRMAVTAPSPLKWMSSAKSGGKRASGWMRKKVPEREGGRVPVTSRSRREASKREGAFMEEKTGVGGNLVGWLGRRCPVGV